MRTQLFLRQTVLSVVSLVSVAGIAATQPSVLLGPLTNTTNGHVYYLLTPDSWTASETEAVALGGHLTAIRNAAEQAWVFSTFGPYARGAGNGLWIGLYDHGVPQSFPTWADGEPVTYTNWSPGEPSGNGDYGQVFGPDDSRAGGWNDQENTSQFIIYGVVEIACGGQSQTQPPCITAPSSGAKPRSQFVAITGTGTPGDQLQVLVNGASAGAPVTIDSQGSWEALPYVGFSTSVIQVQDVTTTDLSNQISVDPQPTIAGLPASNSVGQLLPLRHADIVVAGGSPSPQNIIYGPNYSHVALYLGSDQDGSGTPLIAEAVTTAEAGGASDVRSLPLEESFVWKYNRIAGYETRTQLPSSTRDGVVAWARTISSQNLPYWNTLTDLALPVIGADLLFIQNACNESPQWNGFLVILNANKNSTSKFICSTLVWRAYFEGSGHTLDLSNPNNMSAAPGSLLGSLPVPCKSLFIDDLRPVFIVPETFVRSPLLKQIF